MWLGWCKPIWFKCLTVRWCGSLLVILLSSFCHFILYSLHGWRVHVTLFNILYMDLYPQFFLSILLVANWIILRFWAVPILLLNTYVTLVLDFFFFFRPTHLFWVSRLSLVLSYFYCVYL